MFEYFAFCSLMSKLYLKQSEELYEKSFNSGISSHRCKDVNSWKYLRNWVRTFPCIKCIYCCYITLTLSEHPSGQLVGKLLENVQSNWLICGICLLPCSPSEKLQENVQTSVHVWKQLNKHKCILFNFILVLLFVCVFFFYCTTLLVDTGCFQKLLCD